MPASLGVVQGDGEIPYKPEALAIKKENAEHWIDRDPELKCYLPGIPRAMYMPYPFEITQSTNKIHMAYAFATTARTIHLDKVDGPPADTWMGHSVGRWEGDTLVVDVTDFNDKTWFDRAGNFHSDALHLVERFTLMTPDVIWYEVTIEDPKVFTRPWRIAMPLYRRMEPNIQLLEYRCTEFAEEFLYGHVRKEQLVKRWEGETMIVDITRKVPPGDGSTNGSASRGGKTDAHTTGRRHSECWVCFWREPPDLYRRTTRLPRNSTRTSRSTSRARSRRSNGSIRTSGFTST